MWLGHNKTPKGAEYREAGSTPARSTLEKQWNKLRPLKENEYRLSSGTVLEFSVCHGVTGCPVKFRNVNSGPRWFLLSDGSEETQKACLAWFEKNRKLEDDELRLGSGGFVKMNAKKSDYGDPMVHGD